LIQLPRSLIRQIRAIFRRLAPKSSGSPRPLVLFLMGDDALRIRAVGGEIQAEYHEARTSPVQETFALPLEALADFEGRGGERVTLELRADGKVEAQWQDGLPKVMEYDAIDLSPQPAFPTAADDLARNDPGFLQALDVAMATAAGEPVRYAVNKILLRGQGEIVATDGRQLLVQEGFRFPWSEELFLPRTAVFGCRELPVEESVFIGEQNGCVTLRVGPWSFFLPAETKLRFPNVENAIPAAARLSTRLQLSAADAQFLAKALPRLPGKDTGNSPITVDLDGQARIRAKATGQSRANEVLLSQSRVLGKPVRFVTNREYLARALELGFSEFALVDADSPVLCKQEHRTYAWMLLGKGGAIGPSDDMLQVASAEAGAASVAAAPAAPTPSAPAAAAPPSTNGNGVHQRRKTARRNLGNGTPPRSLIDEAQALKGAMRGVLVQCNQLLRSVRRERKQARLVQHTLTSLRELQRVGS
jgi:hypothetical protein